MGNGKQRLVTTCGRCPDCLRGYRTTRCDAFPGLILSRFLYNSGAVVTGETKATQVPIVVDDAAPENTITFIADGKGGQISIEQAENRTKRCQCDGCTKGEKWCATILSQPIKGKCACYWCRVDFPRNCIGHLEITANEQIRNEELPLPTGLGGIKHDTGKPRLGLIDSGFLVEVAKVLTFGAKKYGDHNWRNGFIWSRPYDAAQRHMIAFWSGEDRDQETGLLHLAHAACCIMFLIVFQLSGKGKDDRWEDGEK